MYIDIKMKYNKNKQMKISLDNISESFFGRKRSESISKRYCVICGEKVIKFTNNISAREFLISGMCEKCQDEVFK